MIRYIFIIILVLSVFFACEDIQRGPKEPKEPWNVGPLKGCEATPINGGAVITYDLSNDPDMLYVMAEYERSGKIFTEKSSVHKNRLTLEGFHRESSVKVKLYKVNKYEQKSAPVEIEFKPLQSVIDIAYKSLQTVAGFGGIVASWDNPLTTELGVRLMYEDKEKSHEMITKEIVFSTSEKEKYIFRGFEPKETNFALTFEDKWGNISDTIKFTATPLFEKKIEKPYLDHRHYIPYDNVSNLNTSSHPMSKLWDNLTNTAFNGWLTYPGKSGLSITVDVGKVVKLSRIVIHGYHRNSQYGQVNILQFELWGIDKIDPVTLKDKAYWLDSLSVRWGAIHGVDPVQTVLPEKTFKDDWQYLGWHSIVRYDLLGDSQGQINQAENGSNYDMPLEAKPVRYVRLFVREVSNQMPPPINNYFSMGEITFYGDDSVPQE